MTYQHYDNYEQWEQERYEKALVGHVIDATADGVIVKLETQTMIDRDTYLTCPVCADVDYHPDGPDSEVIQCRNCGFSNPRSAFPIDELSPTTDRTQYIELVCPTCGDETVEKLRAQIQQIEKGRDFLADQHKRLLEERDEARWFARWYARRYHGLDKLFHKLLASLAEEPDDTN